MNLIIDYRHHKSCSSTLSELGEIVVKYVMAGRAAMNDVQGTRQPMGKIVLLVKESCMRLNRLATMVRNVRSRGENIPMDQMRGRGR